MPCDGQVQPVSGQEDRWSMGRRRCECKARFWAWLALPANTGRHAGPGGVPLKAGGRVKQICRRFVQTIHARSTRESGSIRVESLWTVVVDVHRINGPARAEERSERVPLLIERALRQPILVVIGRR